MIDNPWRERNLERIAQARRILAQARADRHPDNVTDARRNTAGRGASTAGDPAEGDDE